MSIKDKRKKISDKNLETFFQKTDREWDAILSMPKTRERSKSIVRLRNNIKIALDKYEKKRATTNLKDNKEGLIAFLIKNLLRLIGLGSLYEKNKR